MGRLYSVSNAHYGGSLSSDGVTYLYYDALGRQAVRIEPDGNKAQWCYNGLSTVATNCATSKSTHGQPSGWIDFTDEAGIHTQFVQDGLNRLASVFELGLLAAPTSLETDYSYNAADEVRTVDQYGAAGETPRHREFTYDASARLQTSSNPESGVVCYGSWSGGAVGSGSCQAGYDENGNLKAKTDANGMTITYLYDSLDRLSWKTAPDFADTNVYMIYDQGVNGIGRLYEAGHSTAANTHVLDGAPSGGAGTRFVYDAAGRVTATTYFSPERDSWTTGMSLGYDLAGNVTQIGYPDGRLISQGWDSAGRLASITDITSGGSQTQYLGGPVTYWPSGEPMNVSYGNGVTQTYTLNNRLELCHSVASTGALPANPGGGPNLLDIRRTYNGTASVACGNESGNSGNIYAIVDNLNARGSQSFTYDGLNRLSAGAQLDGAYNHNYNYDSFGNMVVHDNLHMNLSYAVDSATNRITLNGTDLQYDAAGQLVGVPNPIGGFHTLAYTAQGLLRSIDNYQTGSYVYDGLDERVLAVTNSMGCEYVYVDGVPMADNNGKKGWTDYIYANGKIIARATSLDAPIHLSGINCTNCGGDVHLRGVDWGCRSRHSEWRCPPRFSICSWRLRRGRHSEFYGRTTRRWIYLRPAR